MDDAAAAVDVERTKEHLGVASAGTAAGGRCSTSEDSAVIETLVRHTFCVGRVPKEMQQRLGNSIAECGKRLAGMDATSARLP